MTLFVNDDFTKVSIIVPNQYNRKGNTGGLWSADDGLMITAPASNRVEALNLANDIMKEYLRGYQLE